MFIWLCEQVKIIPLQETFRTFFSSKSKFTKCSQEPLLMKIGVPVDKINQNGQKITVKELFFDKLQIKVRQLY